MVYKGSKNKIAKYIVPVIETYLRDLSENNPDKSVYYIEPFVGGANMIDKINWDNKIGYDVNKYLIEVHQHAQREPIALQNITKERYREMHAIYKQWGDNDLYDVGYYCCFATFRGGGYSHSYGEHGHAQRVNNVNKQRLNPQYQNIDFKTLNFKELKLDNNSKYVIYLDPPYKGTTDYGLKFNHDDLWAKCKEWKKENPNVIILLSELQAPDDWRVVMEIPHSHCWRDGANKAKDVVEKLFLYEGEKDEK